MTVLCCVSLLLICCMPVDSASKRACPRPLVAAVPPPARVEEPVKGRMPEAGVAVGERLRGGLHGGAAGDGEVKRGGVALAVEAERARRADGYALAADETEAAVEGGAPAAAKRVGVGTTRVAGGGGRAGVRAAGGDTDRGCGSPGGPAAEVVFDASSTVTAGVVAAWPYGGGTMTVAFAVLSCPWRHPSPTTGGGAAAEAAVAAATTVGAVC